MRKIPTLFRRDPDDLSRVLDEAHPDCQWVLDGEGAATRKYDGTCVMFDGTSWWARREVKPGKAEPDGFRAEQHDEETGKTVGWEPMDQSPFVKAFREVEQRLAEFSGRASGLLVPAGTYELCGPKVQGNPEGYTEHRLVQHATADTVDEPAREFRPLLDWLLTQDGVVEGIVWHHPDGRMAKLKVRDAQRTLATEEAR